jgi:mycothiol synthase
MNISQMSARDLDDVASLCGQELVLDRYARSIPAVLARRPHIGLIATRGSTTVGVCIGSVAEDQDGAVEGFVDLLVVGRSSQRQGIGRELANAMEEQLASRGCQLIHLSGHSPYYAWPGIDVRYTAAVCFAEDLGYRRQECEVNMDVDLLRAPLDTGDAEERLRSHGIEIRQAQASDDGPLQESLSCFCAYGLNRPHEVGPVGTSPDLRKLGIGGALLKRSLADQRDHGLTVAELVWAGPLGYFSRTLHATISRAFWLYTKDLASTGQPPDWRDRVGLL